MTLEVINVGAAPNDGTGDVWRDAWIKVNNNFAVVGNGPYVIGPPTSGITLTINQGSLESDQVPGLIVTGNSGHNAFICIAANGAVPNGGASTTFDFQQTSSGDGFITLRKANSTLNVSTGNAIRFQIGPTLSLFSAPAADVLTLLVQGSSNAACTHGAMQVVSSNNVRVATFNNSTGAGGWIAYAHSGADKGYFGDSATLVAGGTTDDVCLMSNNALDLVAGGGALRRVSISATGNVNVFTPSSGSNLTVDQGALSNNVTSGVIVKGNSTFGARMSICGNGSSPSINSFDMVQDGVGDVYVVQRSNHNMAFWTNNSPAFLADNFGQVFFYHGIAINGNTPFPQITGWGTPTGPAVVNNFSGTAATLVQCSNAIAKIITDLKAFGLYGA